METIQCTTESAWLALKLSRLKLEVLSPVFQKSANWLLQNGFAVQFQYCPFFSIQVIKILITILNGLQVLEDVTGEEFVLFMKILSGLKSLQTVSGRQQLVELVAEQADLEQTFNPSDPDCVDRLLQCTRQAVPLFSVSSLFYIASILIIGL